VLTDWVCAICTIKNSGRLTMCAVCDALDPSGGEMECPTTPTKAPANGQAKQTVLPTGCVQFDSYLVCFRRVAAISTQESNAANCRQPSSELASQGASDCFGVPISASHSSLSAFIVL
jgi:hypothetical protein